MNKPKSGIVKTENGWTGYSTFYRHDKFKTTLSIRKWVALRSLFTGKLSLEWWVPVNEPDKRIMIEPDKEE